MAEPLNSKITKYQVDSAALTRYLGQLCVKEHKRRVIRHKDRDLNDFIGLTSQIINVSSSKISCINSESVFGPFMTDSVLNMSNIDIICKYKLREDQIEIWTPPIKQGSKSKSLKMFVIPIKSESMPFLVAQSKFFKSRLRKKESLWTEKPYIRHLNISITPNSYTLNFTIYSSISVKQSLDAFNSVDFIKSFNELASFIITPELTKYEKSGYDKENEDWQIKEHPNEANFYAQITRNTQSIAFHSETQSQTVPGLSKHLLGFQMETLQWLLGHEGMEILPTAQNFADGSDSRSFVVKQIVDHILPHLVDDEALSEALDKYCFGFSRVRLSSNPDKYYWCNMFTANISTRDYAISTIRNAFGSGLRAKALLSEEMGLGKTVEMLSLVLMNPRKDYAPFDTKKLDAFTGDRYLSECKTTLIICPQTIIGQWLSEIREATHLSVMIYEGISDYEKQAQKANTLVNPTNIARELSHYDIILVSYHTVSRELHRAVFKPTRRPKRRCTKRLKFFDPNVTYDYSGKIVMKNHDESQHSDNNSKVVGNGRSDGYIGETDDYERIDYSSPLMLLEFWRVVLDEVQMTASINTNAAKFARIIPRVHSWGVSGTLIKNGLDDLYSLLCFLRYHPIDRFTITSSESPWKLLTDVAPYYQFSRLFKSICLRHTKKMVSDQIRLPKQSRILLRAPFTSIERDNYDFLLDQFLAQVGLDANGDPTVEDYDPERSYGTMQRWLRELRRICCHAQLGKQISSNKHANGNDDHEKLVIGTIGDVLSDLIKRSSTDLSSNQRAYYSLELRKGKIFEFMRLPDSSQSLFESLVIELEKRINDVKNEPVIEKMANVSKLRPWLELLHQAYFLLASSHFQHYRPMKPLPDNFDELVEIESQESGEEKIKIDSALFSADEKKHFDLENTYYNKADKLLLQILEDPLKKVSLCITRMVENFGCIARYKIPLSTLPSPLIKSLKSILDEKMLMKSIQACRVTDLTLIAFQSNFGFNTRTSLFFNRAKKCLEELNVQSHVINAWITKLSVVLKQPVANYADTTKDATGEEYGQTLVNQELANTYLESLQNMLEDREHSIISVESINKYKKGRIFNVSEVTDLNRTVNTELHNKLEKIRKDCMPDGCFNTNYTLKHLWLEVTDIEIGMNSLESNGSEELRSMISTTKGMLKAELDLQKKDIKNLRSRIFEILDDSFNSKVAYFKALQIKSDTLQKYIPVKQVFSDATPYQKAVEDMNSVDRQLQILQGKIRKGTVRLRYLRTLLPAQKGSSESDDNRVGEERVCVICRSEILVGILTSCGHQYCRDCLHIWMKNKPTCPVCKRILHKSDLYVFTRTQKKLSGGLIQGSESDHNSNKKSGSKSELPAGDPDDEEVNKLSNTRLMEKDLFKVYKSLDDDMLRKIVSIPLVESFGSKVDMIVRQALFLRNQEGGVQILVFSQWPQFLHILGQSLKQNGVRYISSADTGRKRRRRVREERGFVNRHQILKFTGEEGSEIEEFKRNPDITCFLLNAKAQAAGLTLTNASHVFLCEPLVNLSLELQAISRVHRIGQTKPTTVWNFVIEDTVEESIAYMSTKRRIELSKERAAIPDVSNDKFVDEDALDVTELSKNSDKLVDKDGEVIADNDLWASFFANRSVRVVDSVVGMHAK